jgi:hypothetical protein
VHRVGNQKVVKSFEQYELQGGTLPASTFVYVDVVVFFKHIKIIDLSTREYRDSPSLIAFLKGTYERCVRRLIDPVYGRDEAVYDVRPRCNQLALDAIFLVDDTAFC